MEIDVDDCKIDHKDLNTEDVLVLIVDRFARKALDASNVLDTQKYLSAAEKGTKMLEFFDRRKMTRALVLDEIVSWIESPVRKSEIYRRYVEACGHKGLIPMSNQEFYAQMKARGVVSKHNQGGDMFYPRLK